MEKSMTRSASFFSAKELTKMALITALYVVVTVVFAVLSFGPLQLRLSEAFNYLALYHKRYVVAVTLGVVIANFMSPTWFLDVPIGGFSTFLVLIICRAVTKNMKHEILKLAITAVIFAVSVFTVAVQFVVLFDAPFYYTWLTMGIGELISMSVGGVVIYLLSKKIDFTK